MRISLELETRFNIGDMVKLPTPKLKGKITRIEMRIEKECEVRLIYTFVTEGGMNVCAPGSELCAAD